MPSRGRVRDPRRGAGKAHRAQSAAAAPLGSAEAAPVSRERRRGPEHGGPSRPPAEQTSGASTAALLRSIAPTISVGILTADLMALGADLARLEGTGVRLLHVDVMDGCFTPTMTVGPPLVRAIRTPWLKDVHLMIRDPLDTLADYVAAGADVITVHVESCTHVHRVLQALGTMTNANDPARGIVRGVALNPGTPLEVLEPLLDEVDLVLILAVNPGWGGQRFIAGAMDRLAKVRRMIAGRDVLLGIDGGITRENVGRFAGAGVDIVVTGSAVFDGRAPAENARRMLRALGTG